MNYCWTCLLLMLALATCGLAEDGGVFALILTGLRMLEHLPSCCPSSEAANNHDKYHVRARWNKGRMNH